VTEPLRLSFSVDCSADHAFHVWTARIDQWWPADHTVSGEKAAEVVLEPRIGGRLFERTPNGVEYEWGEVTAWEPPRRLGYRWHLHQDRADSTEVEVTFVEDGGDATRIEIEHRGWERLGVRGPDRRDANEAGWTGLLPHFTAFLQTVTARGETPT
jgi:uncharacterized protein YndB with AHSA1/START domain